MDKQKLLEDLQRASQEGLLSKEEISSITGVQQQESAVREEVSAKRFNLSEIFFVIGGIIVLIGLIILVAQNWSSMSYALRVFSTFGAGVAFFLGAIFLSKIGILRRLSDVFYILSALLTTGGYFVIFFREEFLRRFDVVLIVVPLLLLIQFGLTQFFTKKNLFTLINTAFGTWLFYSLTNKLMYDSVNTIGRNFLIYYRTMFVGLAYLFIGHFLQMRGKPFASFFDVFGILGVLGTSFALNIMAGFNSIRGFSYPQEFQVSSIWLFLFPLIIAATFFGSVYLKKTSFLFFGTLFLIAYLIRITAQYFSDVMGWPVALIFIGILVIGLGYLAIYINKKYIKKI